jgi:hypothetical protein
MDWKLWERQWFEKWSAELQFHVSLVADVHDFVARVATDDQIVDAKQTQNKLGLFLWSAFLFVAWVTNIER